MEIQELIKLSDKVKSNLKLEEFKNISNDEEEKSGLSVYTTYKGKTIHRKDGFEGLVN